MNNFELLSNLKKKYKTHPHRYCSFRGFTVEDYFRPISIGGVIDLNLLLSTNTNTPTNYRTLVAEFDKISARLNNINDELIEKHLFQIERTLEYAKVDHSDSNMYYDEQKRQIKEFNDAFIRAFHEYQQTTEEIDFSKTTYSEFELYGVYYGVELSKYKLFLETKKEETEEEVTPEPKIKKTEINMPQQILVLEYLGIIDYMRKTLKLTNQNDINYLLSLITGKSQTNIRKELDKKLPDRVKSKSNKAFLTTLKHDFDKMELNAALEQLKKDTK